MVMGKLVGGLCNRLFIMATVYGYARRYSKTPVICVSMSDKNAHSTKDYINSVFSNFAQVNISMTVTQVTHDPFKPMCYVELPFYTGNVLLDGYFQSEHYFKQWYTDFRNLINLPKVPKRQTETCFIHVRRGDYVNNYFHYIPLDSYFEKAIAYVREHVPDVRFLVVSDDIPWCLTYQLFIGMDMLNLQDEVQTLAEMSACNHAICSNSSFSWWGAYLIENANKIAIFPDKWFVDTRYTTQIGFTGATILKT